MSDATNGHLTNGKARGAMDHWPPIAFEYRGDDGKPQVRRVRPCEGSMSFSDSAGEWVFVAHDMDTSKQVVVYLSRIVMFYGAPDMTPKGKPGRCLCGALDRADCGCESRAAAKADGGTR